MFFKITWDKIFFVLCMIFLFVQVFDQWQLYKAGRSSIAKSLIYKSTLKFPHIVICPPLKSEAVSKYLEELYFGIENVETHLHYVIFLGNLYTFCRWTPTTQVFLESLMNSFSITCRNWESACQHFFSIISPNLFGLSCMMRAMTTKLFTLFDFVLRSSIFRPIILHDFLNHSSLSDLINQLSAIALD